MAKKNFHQHLFRARYDATMSVARNDRTSVGQRAHETPWLGLESLEPRLLLSTTFTAVHTFGGGALPGDIQKVAFGDINNDGWTDALVSSQLFVNNNGQFGTSPSLKVGRANVLGDYDNDGWLDVFDYGTIGLHRNNQNGGFTNVSGILAPAQSPVHRSSALGDFNGDGFLDIYLGGYETQIGTNLPDTMMLSQDGTSFTTKWISPGLQPARGVTASDFDEDGDLDIYTSNYRLFPNGLWVNDGNANITDQASTLSATGDNSHTIGSAWGDMDNDGHLDLFVGNFSHPGNPPSMFLRNMGPSGGYAFQSMISLSGPDWQESYASPALADYDNDGDLDLFLTTVYSGDAARLYRNDGNWIFTNVTGQAGLGNIRVTYQAAWADVDNDGDLDLTTDGTLFRNDNNNANHWLKVRLEGDGNTVNRAAIGAQVRLFVGNETLTRQVEAGTGEGNQNDLTLHFGLGSHGASVQVEVTWPDGTTQTFHTAVDRTIDVASDVAFGAKLPYSEDFNDHSADAIRAEAGNWFVNQSQRYRGEADASGVAISLVQLADPLPERFSISAIMRGKKPPGATSINAFAIFDYQSPDSFKFAGPSFDGDSWQIGQVTSNQQQVLASWDENLSNNTDYSVDVVISNDLVTLSGDGVVKVSHEFAQSLAGGQVGIGTYEATAIFDDLNLVRLKDVPTNFDFGTQSSAVEKRFARTMTSDYTFTAGFGWLPGAVGLSALKRNSGTALEKDLVQLSMGTFEIEVDNGRYETTVHLGDTSKARDQMAVSLEGANVETIDTAS
ncbi:MAG: CRTAC1 family protein, partial [Pirellulaceae bacterium]|nr:CRTAC1 family protein [Pirellulaceae bacterium]